MPVLVQRIDGKQREVLLVAPEFGLHHDLARRIGSILSYDCTSIVRDVYNYSRITHQRRPDGPKSTFCVKIQRRRSVTPFSGEDYMVRCST